MIRCDKCIHCTHIAQHIDETYYYCELNEEFIAEYIAISEIPCEGYVEKLDDHETEENSA